MRFPELVTPMHLASLLPILSKAKDPALESNVADYTCINPVDKVSTFFMLNKSIDDFPGAYQQ